MVKPSASAPKLPLEPLDSLVDLACRDGVEIRPTLLRVLTDLYVQKPSHSPEEEAQYVELALGLIDAVDPLTRGTVTATLSAYPGAPEMVLRKLASLPLASRRGDTEGDDLIELFFDANTDERRLILTNLDVTADAASLRPMPAASELVRRLEKAALQRNTGEFARVLERALGVSRELATRITRDPFGEPLVVVGKALGMSADMVQRILLCLNPVIGQSVERVFELAGLFEDLNAAAVHRMLTIWRATAAQRHVVTRGAASAVSESPTAGTVKTAASTSVRPRDPAYARSASFGGFESAEARSAKAESGDPGAAHSESVALGPHRTSAVADLRNLTPTLDLSMSARGDEREDVQRSSQNSSYESVYWNDEKRSARETATRTPPARPAPAARPARFKSNER
jgi:hypothetical protein